MSYAAFVFIGVYAGTGGGLLLSQMNGYGVDRATIGVIFFASSAGFVLAGISTGAVIHRSGVRIALTAGGGAYVLAGFYLATRPPFAAFEALQNEPAWSANSVPPMEVTSGMLPGASTASPVWAIRVPSASQSAAPVSPAGPNQVMPCAFACCAVA